MRILHSVQRILLSRGGTVRAAIDLADGLAHTGHDVRVLTYDTTDKPDAWDRPGAPKTVTITEPEGPTGGHTALQLLEIADHLRWVTRVPEHRGVVHLHSMWQRPNAQIGRACRQLGVPYTISVHGMLDDWSMAQKRLKKRLYWRFVERHLLEGAAFVHCTAQAELDQARRWIGTGHGLVLPLVFDASPYRDDADPDIARRAFGLDPAHRHVLFLSRIHPKKGLDVLLRAVERLARYDLFDDTRLLIAGTGEPDDERDARALAEALGLGDRVRFLGMVKGETKASLYRAADLLALPTQQENFGMVYFEALASGLPVVTTDLIDTVRELEASGGASIADRTPEAFADTIAELLEDPAKRARMGRSGRDWVLEHLDPTRIVSAYTQAYRAAADTAPNDSPTAPPTGPSPREA